MREVIRFGKTVTFEDLNPHNFHLKNDYINNILFCALNTFPYLNSEGIDAKIVRGFVSNGYMEQNLPLVYKEKYSYKYTQGLGLIITWDSYDSTEAILIIPKLVAGIKSNVLARIDHACKQVELLFEMTEPTKIYEVAGGEERQIA